MFLKEDSPKYGEHHANQQERFPETMLQSYVSLDERSFQDLLLHVKNYANFIKFYDLQNREKGNWSAFLLDEAIILAEIQAINPNQFELRFKKKLDIVQRFGRLQKKKEYLLRCFEELFGVSKLIDRWIEELKKIEKICHS